MKKKITVLSALISVLLIIASFVCLYRYDFSSDNGDSAFAFNPVSDMKPGEKYPCFNVQFHPEVREAAGVSFVPLYPVNVVIAVDRSRTSLEISGWNDLASSDLNVSVPGDRMTQKLMFAAIAFGLEGDNFTKESAQKYLRDIKDENRLFTDDKSCPAAICLSTEAAKMAETSKNTEIIVPSEGTIEYLKGYITDALPDTEPAFEEPSYDFYDRFSRETQTTTAIIRRNVFGTRRFDSAYAMEAIMMAVISLAVIVIWAAFTLYRISRKDIRACIFSAAFMLTAWIIIRLVKYNLITSTLTTAMWYSFYIFLMGLPLLLLYVSDIINRPYTGRPVFSRWFLAVSSLYPVFLLTVFTNNYHHLVFTWENSAEYESDYSYGPVYFAIYAYIFIVLLAAIIIMTVKSGKTSGIRGAVLPFSVFVLIIAYATGYALGFPIAKQSDLTIVLSAFSMLLLESAIHSGLVPSNRHYRQIFYQSPLMLRISDRNGHTIMESDVCRNNKRLTEECRNGNYVVHESMAGDIRAEWIEDITGLNRIKSEIDLSFKKLSAANRILQRENIVRKRSISSDARVEIYDKLEKEIHDDNQELSEYVKSYLEKEEDPSLLPYITCLLCHIKRRCNLYFLAEESGIMNSNELMVYLDELSEIAGFTGISSIVKSDISQTISLEKATLFYDFYFYVISDYARAGQGTLLGTLTQNSSSTVFNIWSSGKAENIEFSSDFSDKVKSAGGVISYETGDDSEVCVLSFEEKGGISL